MSTSGAAVAELDVPEVQDVKPQLGGDKPLKRLNINLAPQAFDEVQALSKATGKSMTELVRLGLGLAKIAHEARESQMRLAVVDAGGTPIREIVIP
jgi:hypothetical protein